MTSLLDIGPLTENVDINGNKIPVRGLSATALFELLRDIPELRILMAQKSLTNENAASLISQIPVAVGEVIAAATGHLGDTDHINAAIQLPAGVQLEFLEVIVRLTFPRGVKSFLDGLFALAPQGGSGWGQATRSQEPSSAVSQQDTEQKTAGTTHQDNSQDGST